MLALFPQEIVLDYTPQKICSIFAPFSFFLLPKKMATMAVSRFLPFRSIDPLSGECVHNKWMPWYQFVTKVLFLSCSMFDFINTQPILIFLFCDNCDIDIFTLSSNKYSRRQVFLCNIFTLLQGIVLRVLERLEGLVVRWVKTLWCAI